MRAAAANVKGQVKRVARKVGRPVLQRLDARIDHRILLREQAAPIAALTQHIPALLNAISAQNAAARELRRSELRLQGALAELGDAVANLQRQVEATDGTPPAAVVEALPRSAPPAPEADGGQVSRAIAAP